MKTKILNKIEPVFWELVRALGTYPSEDGRKDARDTLLVPLAGEIAKNPDTVLDRKSAHSFLMACADEYCARLGVDLNESTLHVWENFVDHVVTQVSIARDEATVFVLITENAFGDTIVNGVYSSYEAAVDRAQALCEEEAEDCDEFSVEQIRSFPREVGRTIVRSAFNSDYFVEPMVIRS